MTYVSRYLEPNIIERLNHLQLSARSVVEGTTTGHHRSPVKGASVEFRQHRFYTPGDEPRRLDWRVLGRTDRPYIKEYDEETNLRCVLMIDCSGSMGYAGQAGADGRGSSHPPADENASASLDLAASATPAGGSSERGPKFDYAARIVASLAYLMLGQTESVGLALFDGKIRQWLPPRSGTGQLSQVVDVLERSTPRGPSGLGKALQEVADRLGRRSLVIAVSDAFSPIPGIREGLARLRHDRHETILLQVLDPDEVSFPFRTWTRFRGLEGEHPRLLEPALVRKAYLSRFRRHRQELAETCRALGAEFYSFVTDKPLIDSVTLFLQRRAAAGRA
jgi:uncharacterized protein (DUF58 family)